MFWDDFGNKVLAATWRRLSFHSHFQFLLTTLRGITTQTEEEEEQQAGGGEGLGYEAASGKAAQEGPAQKTRLSTRLLEKVWFCSPRLPRFSTSLFSFPFQGEKGSIPPREGMSWPAAASATAPTLQSENLLRKMKKRDHPVLKTSPTRASRKVLA